MSACCILPTIASTSIVTMSGVDLSKLAIKAVASGVAMAGVSYYVLKRKDYIEIFGMEMAHWQGDGALLAVSSAAGDVVGTWALSKIEQKFLSSPKLMHFVNAATVPLLSGVAYGGLKSAIVQPKSNKSMLKEIGLGSLVKFGSDSAVTNMFSL